MNLGLQKRIKEAAKKASASLNDDCYIHMNEAVECSYVDGYRDGAELGYKEAIAQAIRWWKEEIFEHYDETCELIVRHITKEELFKGFEKEMLELLEETK